MSELCANLLCSSNNMVRLDLHSNGTDRVLIQDFDNNELTIITGQNATYPHGVCETRWAAKVCSCMAPAWLEEDQGGRNVRPWFCSCMAPAWLGQDHVVLQASPGVLHLLGACQPRPSSLYAPVRSAEPLFSCTASGGLDHNQVVSSLRTAQSRQLQTAIIYSQGPIHLIPATSDHVHSAIAASCRQSLQDMQVQASMSLVNQLPAFTEVP